MNKEEKKTRKRKIENIEDVDNRPKKKRAAAKPRKQQQEKKQDDIPIIYYI